MNNEHAIEIMKAYRDRLTSSCSNQLDSDIEAYDLAIKALNTQESLEKKIEFLMNERHGEWITIHKQNSFGQDCICFECDKCHKYTVPIYKLMIKEPLEVCPNCGADMRGNADADSQ